MLGGTLVRDNVAAEPAMEIMQPLVQAYDASAEAHYALGLVAMNVERWDLANLAQKARARIGGGNFVLMKDLSAPIVVNGRHWGGLRIGFKIAV